jgi:hypothetical protein
VSEASWAVSGGPGLQVTEGFTMSLLDLSTRVHGVPGIDLSIKLLPGDSLVTRARNTLVALFLGMPQYTHLLFVDSDITFSPDSVFRLLEMSKRKPIVAAPYPKKGFIYDGLKSHIKATLEQVRACRRCPGALTVSSSCLGWPIWSRTPTTSSRTRRSRTP